MTSYSIGDPVVWQGKDTEPNDCVVAAIDTQHTPATYVVRFADGSKRYAREEQLVRAALVDPKSVPAPDQNKDTVSQRLTGMASKLFGQVSSTASDISKTAQKTVKSAQERARERLNKQQPAPAKKEETSDAEQQPPATDTADALPCPAPGAGQSEEERDVQKLVEFGYPEHNARSALILADGDIERAVAFLNEQADEVEVEEEQDVDDFLTPAPAPAPVAPVQEVQAQPQVDPLAHFDPVPAAAAPAPAPASVQSQPPAAQLRQQQSADDTFEFLSSPATPSVQTPTSPIPTSGAAPVEVLSTQTGSVTLRVTPSALPKPTNGETVVSHYSIGVKPQSSARWQHFADRRSGRVTPFSDAGAAWVETSYPHKPSGSDVVTLAFGCFKQHDTYDICVRSVTPSGPAPPCQPISVGVETEAMKVGMDELGDFLTASSPRSPVSGASPGHSPVRHSYRTHARGEIYDID